MTPVGCLYSRIRAKTVQKELSRMTTTLDIKGSEKKVAGWKALFSPRKTETQQQPRVRPLDIRPQTSRRPTSARSYQEEKKEESTTPPTVRTSTSDAKKRIHMQVEIEAYTYGFDVAYSDYLGRYNKLWAAIEHLDPLQSYQLLRGIVRHADLLASCVVAFNEVIQVVPEGPDRKRKQRMMKRRLNTMLYALKSTIIQTRTVREVLMDIACTSQEEYRPAFQVQMDKMNVVRQKLEETYQTITSASMIDKDKRENDEIDEGHQVAHLHKRYNDPARDKEVHEEHNFSSPIRESPEEDDEDARRSSGSSDD